MFELSTRRSLHLTRQTSRKNALQDEGNRTKVCGVEESRKFAKLASRAHVREDES